MAGGPVIKVLLVDDHMIMREGLATMLATDNIVVIGAVGSGEEALNFISSEEVPDVIIMDIVMRGMSGIEATRWIKEQHPGLKIILLSMEVKKEFVTAGIQAGISGYLHKDVPKETLIEAIIKVHGGEKYFNEAITNLVFEDFYIKTKDSSPVKVTLSEELTKRETEVLTLVAKGRSNKEVADQLFISVKTVETHKAHILDKLGLKNTAELVRYAIRNNLVPLD